jgi:hypothetical protein
VAMCDVNTKSRDVSETSAEYFDVLSQNSSILGGPFLRILVLLPMVKQPLVGHDLLFIDASRSHSDTPHSVALLCTSDQPNAQTST